MFGIARNKAVDRMRRGAREVLAEPDDSLPDDAPNPEAVVVAASDAARVRECMGRLSDTHRSAIHLAFWRELPYGEIAEIEGVPVGTVKTRILHAKRLLMHCLGDVPDGLKPSGQVIPLQYQILPDRRLTGNGRTRRLTVPVRSPRRPRRTPGPGGSSRRESRAGW